jgi:hypothetical protein
MRSMPMNDCMIHTSTTAIAAEACVMRSLQMNDYMSCTCTTATTTIEKACGTCFL